MIYSLCAQKGGSGKTSTAQAILSGATLRGKKALAVDADAQGNLSFSTGADRKKPGTWELLTGSAKPADVIQHTEQGDVIAAGPMLATADTVLKGNTRYNGLARALRVFRPEYDLIVLDSGAANGCLLLNVLSASDAVIIPTAAACYALQGLISIVDIIRETRAQYNHSLKIRGILFTMYSGRTNSARAYTKAIEAQAKKWRIPVFSTRIRKGVAVEESQTARESIFTYSPRSNPAQDYSNFLDELEI